MVTGVACSSEQAASPTPAASQSPAPQAPVESADSINMQGYIAARIAQEKINLMFADQTAEDGSFVLKFTIADGKESAVKFLTAYVDAGLADKLAAHYITDKKAGDAILTNQTPFFPVDILTLKKEDVTFDAANTADQVVYTTKEGVTVTTKKVNGTFVLVDVAKK